MMKERPILFSAEMVRAILDGRKTQTRRVCKLGSDWPYYRGFNEQEKTHRFSNTDQYLALPSNRSKYVPCPYGVPGDRLFMTQGAAGVTRAIPFDERFWSRVTKTGDCWEWMGRVNRKKYGIIRRGKKSYSVHRVSWMLHTGMAAPREKHVLHKCDVPWCVNPDHLWLGSNDDNIADKMTKGRHRAPVGENQRSSRLTWEQVHEIRALYWEQNYYQKDIAYAFDIHQSQVSKIVNKKQWADPKPPLQVKGNRLLEVTEVRVERVQEISEVDAIAEGLEEIAWGVYTSGEKSYPDTRDPIDWFHKLWNSINAKRGHGWAVNPWVWVVEFRVLERGE